MFRWGTFVGASGNTFGWKIACDDLTASDWDCVAKAGLKHIGPFGSVWGVPRGGLYLAEALEKHAKDGPPLIVDDVWTTGYSMRSLAAKHELKHWKGFVLFARGETPPNVMAMFRTKFD